MNELAQRTGLVICAHGSASVEWNEAVEELVEAVATTARVEDAFDAGVRAAFLGPHTPTVRDALGSLVGCGATEVVAVPLFLTPSVHASKDLPRALGLTDSPDGDADELDEDALFPGVSVQVTGGDDLIECVAANVVGRACALSTDPAHEGVVIVYYGSSRHPDVWRALIERVGEAVENAGFSTWAASPIGHLVDSSPVPTAEATERLLNACETALVVPMLVSTGRYQREVIPAAIGLLSDEEQARVRVCSGALLPDPAVVSWVAARALGSLKRR